MNPVTHRMPIEELIANVLETRFENFDQISVENAKRRMIDVVGCLIGGANAPENLPLEECLEKTLDPSYSFVYENEKLGKGGVHEKFKGT